MIDTLIKNKRYKATIQLSIGESLVATNKVLQKKFEDIGFVDVQVTGTGGIRHASGKWPNENQPINKSQLPSQIASIINE